MDESILNTVIDGYQIEDRIKAGGVAVVYLARHLKSNEIVAFKLLQGGWIEHEEILIRFEREASIMRQLKHPHVVEFKEYGKHKGRPYIVMEYLPGGSLSERIKENPFITLGGVARLIDQVASALDYAHSKGIVHRDLKPGNILLRDNTHASLTDFGIARLMEHTMVTRMGQMPGTPHYMSPEQARGATEINLQSDLYSLAVIAYLLSTGKLPFSGFDPLVVINQHLTAQPPIPSEINADLPPEVDRVLLRGLAKKPDQRFASVGAFARAFSHSLRDHEDVPVILSKRYKAKQGNGEPIEIEKIFSSKAYTVQSELDHKPLKIESITKRRRRQKIMNRGFIGGIVAIILVLIVAILVLAGGSSGDNPSDGTIESSLMAFNTAPATLTQRPSASPDVAASEAAAALIEEANQTATSASQTAESVQLTTIAMTEAAARETAFAELLVGTADALTATADALTATADAWTHTPQPATTQPPTTTPPPPTQTHTPSPTTTPPPPTQTHTPSPTATPTATPIFYTVNDFINASVNGGFGTAGRFNCVMFLEANAFVEEKFAANDPEYAPLMPYIQDPSSAFQRIYADNCQDQSTNTQVSIAPPSLWTDMRNDFIDLRNTLN